MCSTGATGYIGGDALHAIVQAHPEYEVSCLVRNSEKGAQVASRFPKVRLLYGDLDSLDILEAEAKLANVVLRGPPFSSHRMISNVTKITNQLHVDCAHTDHEASVKALLKGLAAHSPPQPSYLIHTSGTGILMFTDMERQIYGEASSTVYDDWAGIEDITSLPDYAPHRNVEKIVLASGTEQGSNVRSAIVCPPTIYGKGRGPGNQRSQQMPDLAKGTLRRGQGFYVGKGKTCWANVHVIDLSDCFLKLVEAAAVGGGTATWGKEGYYFTENGEHVWSNAAEWVASAAQEQGYIASDQVDSLTLEEVTQLIGHGSILLGANSRCKAVRARKLLGWSPNQKSMKDETPELVHSEAILLGKGHAAKAVS